MDSIITRGQCIGGIIGLGIGIAIGIVFALLMAPRIGIFSLFALMCAPVGLIFGIGIMSLIVCFDLRNNENEY